MATLSQRLGRQRQGAGCQPRASAELSPERGSRRAWGPKTRGAKDGETAGKPVPSELWASWTGREHPIPVGM